MILTLLIYIFFSIFYLLANMSYNFKVIPLHAVRATSVYLYRVVKQAFVEYSYCNKRCVPRMQEVVKYKSKYKRLVYYRNPLSGRNVKWVKNRLNFYLCKYASVLLENNQCRIFHILSYFLFEKSISNNHVTQQKINKFRSKNV